MSKYSLFEAFLNEALRDKYVCGLKSEAIRRMQRSEDDLTYDKAVKIVLSIELAEGQVRAMVPKLINKVSIQNGRNNKYQEAKSSLSHNRYRVNQSENKSPSTSQSQLNSHRMNQNQYQRCLKFHKNQKQCPAKSWKFF